MKDLIRKYALQNAVKHEGKAVVGSVIGALMQEDPTLKVRIKDLSKNIVMIVNEVNSLSLEDQIKQLQELAPELLKEKVKEKRHGLKELSNSSDKMVFRFAPSPSGPMHVGHAIVLGLNYLYKQKYDGKLILRIEDTNPENIDPTAYTALETDGQWITNNEINEIIVQSDRLQIYYDYCERLIAIGKAYVCKCSSEYFKKLVDQKIACPCREVPKQNQLVEWQRMFNETKQGSAVVRIKTDLNHKNPAMRDWPAMRINEQHHPRVNARVWPLMNLSVAIDDHEMEVTHTIRAKEHMDNAKRQKYVLDYFGWNDPTHLFIGRINFEGMNLSTSQTRKLIEAGEYEGWQDIRLPFLGALKRRGYQPEAFLKFVEELGITQNDKTVTKEDFFKTLNYHNKQILEPVSDRYFFVQDPIKLLVKNAPSCDVEINLHPEFIARGVRKFKTSDEFYISKKDQIENNKLYRLMDCLNFKNGKFDSLEYENYKKTGEAIIHWLPVSDDLVKVSVRMPDNKLVYGFGESGLANLKEGSVIQFERFGFVRFDKRNDDILEFWYAHN